MHYLHKCFILFPGIFSKILNWSFQVDLIFLTENQFLWYSILLTKTPSNKIQITFLGSRFYNHRSLRTKLEVLWDNITKVAFGLSSSSGFCVWRPFPSYLPYRAPSRPLFLMTFAYSLADLYGTRGLAGSSKSTWKRPNRLLYPLFHSKLSRSDHAQYTWRLTSSTWIAERKRIISTSGKVLRTHIPEEYWAPLSPALLEISVGIDQILLCLFNHKHNAEAKYSLGSNAYIT